VWALADGEWSGDDWGIKPLRLPRAQSAIVRDNLFGPKRLLGAHHPLSPNINFATRAQERKKKRCLRSQVRENMPVHTFDFQHSKPTHLSLEALPGRVQEYNLASLRYSPWHYQLFTKQSKSEIPHLRL